MYSDLSLKENIKDITDSSAILELRPVSFNLKKGTKLQFGFIAQELEGTSLENLVYMNDNKLRSVAYNQLIPLLVHQIQILSERVAELEGKP